MTYDPELTEATWILAAEDGNILAATRGYSALRAKYPELQEYLKMWHRVWPGSRVGWPDYDRELNGQNGKPSLHLHASPMLLTLADGTNDLSRQLCGMLIRIAELRTAGNIAVKFELTAAEQRVAEMVREGESPMVIASRLGLSVNTVRAHMKRLFAKTGVHSRASLVRVLMETKIAEAESQPVLGGGRR